MKQIILLYKKETTEIVLFRDIEMHWDNSFLFVMKTTTFLFE